MTRLILGTLVCLFAGGCATPSGTSSTSSPAAASTSAAAAKTSPNPSGAQSMQLGNFSLSLTVKDLAASRAFYEKLGFKVFPGPSAPNMVIMQNDTCTIGLFHGMFDKNTITFNPGWDRSCRTLPAFDDVREVQKTLKSRGLNPVPAADESTTGPAYLMVIDPDGNPILLDQHVPAPAKK